MKLIITIKISGSQRFLITLYDDDDDDDKQKEKTCTLIDVAVTADRNIVHKGSGKVVEIKEFKYRDKKNVEPEMYDYTSNNWRHSNSNEKPKEKFGSCTRKTFDRFNKKDSYTWNITHNTESTAV